MTIGGRDPELGAEALRLARAWLADRNSLDRDVAPYALTAVARHGQRELFDQYMSALPDLNAQMSPMNLIAALGAFRDPGLMRAALARVLDERSSDPREMRGSSPRNGGRPAQSTGSSSGRISKPSIRAFPARTESHMAPSPCAGVV